MKPHLRILLQFIFNLLLPAYSFAQSDACGTATPLISAPGCFNTAGTLPVTATYTIIPTLGCGTANNDVWYTFIANSSNPTITLSTITVANVRLQIFSGTCAALTSVACGTTSIAAAGLTPGTSYLIRIYSTTNAIGTFNICITDPHNVCGSAVTLTSGTSCTNIPGNMYGASLTATTINAPDCASSATYDIWYKFVAQTTNPTITLSSIGVNFTNPGIQLLSNNCGSTFTPYFCGTTSIAADFLTPGTTYFIRVYTTSAVGPVSPVNAGFNICITDPVAAAPYNDECVNAINLPISISCSTVPGTVAAATASSTPVAPCTGPVAYDVWYKFTAVSSSSTINLTSIGTNFTNTRLQLFSGTCGSLTSLACGTTTITNATTAGTTYYVRVYSTSGPAPNGNANFNICVSGANAPVKFGNSYVNISRKTTGGVVQPGDTLEIRMTINHTSGTMTALRYVDNIPTKTSMLAGSGDSIRIITNEGLTYKRYTVAADGDAGSYKAVPAAGEYNIRLNLGFASGATPGSPTVMTNAATSANGQMNAASDRPKGGGGMLFAIAYRVKVSGIVGDTIILSPGQFIYNNGVSDVTLTATPFKIMISNPLSLCSNSIGLNIAEEFGGTFGSGTQLNRNSDLTTPINSYTFISNVNAINLVNDGRYAIVKNLSNRSSTVRDARRQNTCNIPTTLAVNDPYSCNNRMFSGFWYIDGDHTGTSDAIGNTPPASSSNGGYMLMVNADYIASKVYQQNITNLCPNTYYKFSAWVRNICPTCGIDSTGTSTYKPGVLPNLTFSLDDVDYYSTGEVDTAGWLEKGFVFKTGSFQTSATFSIRNNSQGGGGNDWTLDDIGIRTCAPDITVTPGPNPFVCDSNTVDLGATIASYFDNYVYYTWEKSTDNGATWTSTGVSGGPMSPTWNGSAWAYDVTYPPFVAYAADSGSQYRVVVASTISNLSNSNCSFSTGSTITLTVDPCDALLDVDILSFKGKNENSQGVLYLTTSKESEPVKYEIQKSKDASRFISIGEIRGFRDPAAELNNYTYTDPELLDNTLSWYRIKAINTQNNKYKYSKVIQLIGDKAGFQIESLINPFKSEIKFDLISGVDGLVQVQIFDQYQHKLKSASYNLVKGKNKITISNTDNLPAGLYILKVVSETNIINRKIIKRN
jgi:hypothetical protein